MHFQWAGLCLYAWVRMCLYGCVCAHVSVFDVVIKQRTHLAIPIQNTLRGHGSGTQPIFRWFFVIRNQKLTCPKSDYVYHWAIMWSNAAEKAFHFLSSIDVELETWRVCACACMCVCDQSRNQYCRSGFSSPALLFICCNVKRFLFSYWAIGTAKSMWMQNFTVSHGNNAKELDTIDRQWQCNYKNRLHVLSVKSKNTSLVCVVHVVVVVVVAQHYHSCFSFRCQYLSHVVAIDAAPATVTAFLWVCFLCGTTEKPIFILCKQNRCVYFCSLHLWAAICHICLFHLCEWPCANVCLCALTFWFVALSF